MAVQVVIDVAERQAVGLVKEILKENIGTVVKAGTAHVALKAIDTASDVLGILDEATIRAAETIEVGTKKIANVATKGADNNDIKRLHPGDTGTDYILVKINEGNIISTMGRSRSFEFVFISSNGEMLYHTSTQTRKRQKIKVFNSCGKVVGEIKAKGTLFYPRLAVSVKGKYIGDFGKTSRDDKSGKYQLKTIRIKQWLGGIGGIEFLNDRGELLANEHRVKGKRCIVFQSNDDPLVLAIIYICFSIIDVVFSLPERVQHLNY